MPARRQIRVIKVSSERVLGVAFSPDGKLLATAGQGGSARLWDVATGRQVGAAMTPGPDSPNQNRPGWVTAVTFSPDGKTLATDTQFKAQLWNVATQQQTGRPLGAVARFGRRVQPGVQPGQQDPRHGRQSHDPAVERGHPPRDRHGHVRRPDRRVRGRVQPERQDPGDDGHQRGNPAVERGHAPADRQADRAEGPARIPPGSLSPNGKILATTQFDGPAQLWHLETENQNLNAVTLKTAPRTET